VILQLARLLQQRVKIEDKKALRDAALVALGALASFLLTALRRAVSKKTTEQNHAKTDDLPPHRGRTSRTKRKKQGKTRAICMHPVTSDDDST